MNIKNSLCIVCGAAGGFLTFLLGEWSSDLIMLVIFMSIDFITGLIVAGVFQNSRKTEGGALSSAVTYKGILKKIVMLFFVAIAHAVDGYVGVHFLRGATIIGFAVNELISITENAGLMGITSPIINEAIEILKGKGGKHE